MKKQNLFLVVGIVIALVLMPAVFQSNSALCPLRASAQENPCLKQDATISALNLENLKLRSTNSALELENVGLQMTNAAPPSVPSAREVTSPTSEDPPQSLFCFWLSNLKKGKEQKSLDFPWIRLYS